MIGKNSNISGFSYSGELFAFIGIGDAKSYLLRTISVVEASTFSPYTHKSDRYDGSHAPIVLCLFIVSMSIVNCF